MRILGIDPGLRLQGWGIIDADHGRISHVANGVHKSNENEDLSRRLLSLHEQLSEVLETYKPTEAAVESTFVNADGAGSLKLSQARGGALLTAAIAGLSIGEYAPNRVKKTVVGTGHAAKDQVQYMVKMQLPGIEIAGPDAADALAIALCHAHFTQGLGGLEAAIRRARK